MYSEWKFAQKPICHTTLSHTYTTRNAYIEKETGKLRCKLITACVYRVAFYVAKYMVASFSSISRHQKYKVRVIFFRNIIRTHTHTCIWMRISNFRPNDVYFWQCFRKSKPFRGFFPPLSPFCARSCCCWWWWWCCYLYSELSKYVCFYMRKLNPMNSRRKMFREKCVNHP